MANLTKRDSYKANIVKQLRFCRDVNKDTVTIGDISTRQRILEDYWNRFQNVHDAILEVTGKDLLEGQYVEFEAAETFYLQAAARLDELRREMEIPRAVDRPENPQLRASEKTIQKIHLWPTFRHTQKIWIVCICDMNS